MAMETGAAWTCSGTASSAAQPCGGFERGVAQETRRHLQGRGAAELPVRGQQLVQPRIAASPVPCSDVTSTCCGSYRRAALGRRAASAPVAAQPTAPAGRCRHSSPPPPQPPATPARPPASSGNGVVGGSRPAAARRPQAACTASGGRRIAGRLLAAGASADAPESRHPAPAAPVPASAAHHRSGGRLSSCRACASASQIASTRGKFLARQLAIGQGRDQLTVLRHRFHGVHGQLVPAGQSFAVR